MSEPWVIFNGKTMRIYCVYRDYCAAKAVLDQVRRLPVQHMPKVLTMASKQRYDDMLFLSQYEQVVT